MAQFFELLLLLGDLFALLFDERAQLDVIVAGSAAASGES
jgi:hypothetical protein